MLKVDMAGLSEREVEHAVLRHCAAFGSVKQVRVHAARGTLARPFALVDMETESQAERLAAAFGQRTVGNSVVIVLQQERIEATPRVQARDKSGGAALDSTLTLILSELRRQS